MLQAVERQLKLALKLMTKGTQVDVIGARGSGRTTFLELLRDRLVTHNKEVFFVRGIEALQSSGLVALGVAGLEFQREKRASGAVATAVSELAHRGERGQLIIMIDDWDHLDDASRGVIESVRSGYGAGLVLSRHRPSADQIPAQLSAGPAFTIDLEPLGFDELSALIIEKLKGPVDNSALSRIFAKSGGNVGLATAVVDVAVCEQRIQLMHGVWTARGELWSPALRSTIEAQLGGIGEDYVHLEKLALAGAIDVQSCISLVGWNALERLERRGLLQVFPAGQRQLVGVFPPLIVEYFRHESHSVHNLRLEEEIAAALGDERHSTETSGFEEAHAEESEAMLVRLLREQQRSLRLATHSDWRRSRRAAAGIRYAHALLDAGIELDSIESLLLECKKLVDTDEDRARLAVLTSRWRSQNGVRSEEVLQELKSARARAGLYSGLLDAAAAELLLLEGRPDTEIEPLLSVHSGMPDEVIGAVHELGSLYDIVRCRFDDALRRITNARQLSNYQQTDRGRVIEILAILGLGQIDDATEMAKEYLEQARIHLDTDAVRMAAYAAAFCHVCRGDLAEALHLARIDAALGEPPAQLAPFVIALNVFLATIPYRRGDTDTIHSSQPRITLRETGCLPFMSFEWVDALELVSEGKSTEAGALLNTGAEGLWERGLLFAGALMALEAIEVSGEAVILESWKTRLSSLAGDLIGLRLRFLEATVLQSPRMLLNVASELTAHERFSLALSALRNVELWSRADGDSALEAEALAMRHTIEVTAESCVLVDQRYLKSAFDLSARELQIASRVVDGLTNQQIADELVVSVRTVESHLHRIMKKLGVDNRRLIGGPLSDYYRGRRLR